MPKKYIKREVLIESIKNRFKKLIDDGYVYEEIVDCNAEIVELIISLPTADVTEVKHGKWVKDRNCYTCSECGFYYFANNSKSNYCPNCGAKMDKE